VIGQDSALERVANSAGEIARLSDPNRKPMGRSFSAHRRQENGTRARLHRFCLTMKNHDSAGRSSEYMESIRSRRMIGALRVLRRLEGGQLTEQVRRHPYSVILFDRNGKGASRRVQHSVCRFWDGRLTDGKGCAQSISATPAL
jgi:hypothetical protein